MSTYRETVQRLSGAQKSATGAPAYSRFVNRRLGRYLAAAAYLRGLTPNAVTAVSAVLTFAGIAVIAVAEPRWWVGVLVCLLLVTGYALDAADGQLARLRGGGSVSGEWLDHMVDALKISTLHLAVALSVFRFFDVDERWTLVPMGFAIVGAVAFFGMILNDQLRRQHGVASASGPPVQGARPSIVRSLLVVPTDYGLLCLAFLLLGSASVFLAVYTLLFAGSAGYLVLALVKWYRDMAGLESVVARPPAVGPLETMGDPR